MVNKNATKHLHTAAHLHHHFLLVEAKLKHVAQSPRSTRR